MAKKFMLMRFLQEIQGYAEVTNRQPAPRSPAVFMMQLREQRTQPQQVSRRQPLAITTAWQNGPEVELPVRIHHLEPR